MQKSLKKLKIGLNYFTLTTNLPCFANNNRLVGRVPRFRQNDHSVEGSDFSSC